LRFNDESRAVIRNRLAAASRGYFGTSGIYTLSEFSECFRSVRFRGSARVGISAAVARKKKREGERERERERERINEPASEHDHVHGIFPFGDVETRVNRFFSNQNSQSIGAGGSRPLTPLSVPKAPFFFFLRLKSLTCLVILRRRKEIVNDHNRCA